MVITVAPAVISSSPTAAPLTAPVPSASRPVDPPTERDVDTELGGGVTEGVDQALARSLGEVRAGSGLVATDDQLVVEGHAERHQPVDGGAALVGEAAHETGHHLPLVDGHVLPVEPLGVVVDAGRGLHRRAGTHDDPPGEPGGPADLALGLGDQDRGARLAGTDRRTQAGGTRAHDEDVDVTHRRHASPGVSVRGGTCR